MSAHASPVCPHCGSGSVVDRRLLYAAIVFFLGLGAVGEVVGLVHDLLSAWPRWSRSALPLLGLLTATVPAAPQAVGSIRRARWKCRQCWWVWAPSTSAIGPRGQHDQLLADY